MYVDTLVLCLMPGMGEGGAGRECEVEGVAGGTAGAARHQPRPPPHRLLGGHPALQAAHNNYLVQHTRYSCKLGNKSYTYNLF